MKIKSAIMGCLLTGLFQTGMTQAAKCEYIVTNDWGSGFTANIRITNDGSSPLNGWSVSWSYSDGSRMTNSWNANTSGSNPYSATPLNWNSTIGVGSSIEFGMQGTNGSSKAQVASISGSVCSGVTSSVSSSSRSSSVSSSSRSSSISSSSRSSSLSSSSRSSSISSSSRSSSLSSSSRSSSRSISSSSRSSSISSSSRSSSLSSSSRSSSISSSSRSSSLSSSSRSNSSSSASSIPPIVNGCNGYATRYWDCCKAHCSWSGNVPSPVAALPSCSFNNSKISDLTVASSCDGGGAHMCWDQAPFAVSDTLSYGYAATSSGDVCGRCYQLEFTGSSYNAPGDPGSSALAGKTMIVQATNIGHDVGGGQFDILIPGGGVGAFNACGAQWGVSNSELGAQYGGFLAACKQQLGYSASLSQYKACVTNRCNSVFGSRGLTQLQQACLWYVDWFQVADNPSLKYKEVACPAELTSRSGMNRGVLNDIKTSCN